MVEEKRWELSSDSYIYEQPRMTGHPSYPSRPHAVFILRMKLLALRIARRAVVDKGEFVLPAVSRHQ